MRVSAFCVVVLLSACASEKPEARADAQTVAPVVVAQVADPLVPVPEGWLERRKLNYAIRVRPSSHALSRIEPLTALVEKELARVREAMGVGGDEAVGLVIYFHDSDKDKGGPGKQRALTSWREDGEISAHYLATADFDDQVEAFTALIPNELARATTFAALRLTPEDHLDDANSLLAWLMEGPAILLRTGGWYGRDVDALTIAFIDAGLDAPLPKILSSNYQVEWRFNPHRTHTFNLVEFPELASFTRFLWGVRGPHQYVNLMRMIRANGEAGAVEAFQANYDASLGELETQWRAALKEKSATLRDASIDAPRFGKVVKLYVAVLEASARNLTFDNLNLGTWGKKYGADISVNPLLKIELDAAEPALTRAQAGLVTELRASAAAMVKGFGVKLSIPVSAAGGLTPAASVVTFVPPKSAGAKRGIKVGDELHLLDAELTGAAPGKAYTGVVRLTRAGTPVVLDAAVP